MSVLDLLLPISCCSCGARGRVVCADCEDAADLTTRQRTLSNGLTVYSGAEYESLVRDAVLTVKKSGSVKLQAWLADLGLAGLRTCADDVQLSALTLVPLHSGRETFARSGVDIPVAFARRISRLASTHGLTVKVVDALRQPRRASVQKALTTEQRSENAQSAFRVRRRAESLAGAVVLFDDVITTGASLAAAAGAGREAGWKVAGAVTIASTPLRAQSFGQELVRGE